MEREILWTGIGGQGVQLAASVLAQAALAEGRDVQMFGAYGGMMRGGTTEATVVVADERVEAPPTVGAAWAALVMHPEYAVSTVARVRPGGVLFLNTTVGADPIGRADVEVTALAATDMASGLGSALAAAMVMLGAFAAKTGLVSLVALRDAARRCVPSYRVQHVEGNDRALLAGADAVLAERRR